MRSITFATMLLSILLLTGNAAKGADIRLTRFDGNWWNSQTRSDKLSYVVGFFDGQTYAYRTFDWAMVLAIGDPKTPEKFDPVRRRILVEASDLATKAFDRDFGNVTAGQLVAGLDTIYADYRNTRIKPTNAILVVIRSIGGSSDAVIAKMLEHWRQESSK